MKNIFVIIPAYNEEKSIGEVIKKVQKLGKEKWNIIVVDDGSIDDTRKIAQESGVTVLYYDKQHGTSHAVKLALSFIKPKKPNVVVFLDADGQHDPKDIPKLLFHLTRGVDMVIASRYLKKTTNCTALSRIIGTKILSILFKIVFNIHIHDATSGFRAINTRAISLLIQYYPVVFPEPEVICYFLQNKLRINEVSIAMYRRNHGTSSISITKGVLLMFYMFYRMALYVVQRRQ